MSDTLIQVLFYGGMPILVLTGMWLVERLRKKRSAYRTLFGTEKPMSREAYMKLERGKYDLLALAREGIVGQPKHGGPEEELTPEDIEERTQYLKEVDQGLHRDPL